MILTTVMPYMASAVRSVQGAQSAEPVACHQIHQRLPQILGLQTPAAAPVVVVILIRSIPVPVPVPVFFVSFPHVTVGGTPAAARRAYVYVYGKRNGSSHTSIT
jgi:hypothetical protein